MKKILLGIMCFALTLSITTACNKKEKTTDESENKEITENSKYTELEIFGAKVKFKLANPTYLWNSNDDFGAGEVDTVFIPSKNGEPVEDYFYVDNISGIMFQTSDDVLESTSSLKKIYKNAYGMDLTVEQLEDDIFEKHLKGETSKIYFESYCFKYEGFSDEDPSEVYYAIELMLYKNDYTQEEINKIIEEYHLIIDTFEFVK